MQSETLSFESEPVAVPSFFDTAVTDASLASLGPITAAFDRLSAYQQLPASEGVHLTIELTHRLIGTIERLRAAGHAREEIVRRLTRIRAIHAESPFIRRLQEWPRGYAGDFETVEYLLRQRNGAAMGRIGYFLEQYALASPIAQQHRNKVDLQATELLAAARAARGGAAARILLMAAGGSPDLRQVEQTLSEYPFSVTLLDQDRDALTFGASHLRFVRDRVRLVAANVVRGLSSAAGHDRFDLVLAGGLFDYLPDRVAITVLKTVRQRLLRPGGGRLLFTNIGFGNPYQTWIEHLAEWFLIHRSTADVISLCTAAGFREEAIDVETDRTGLTLIVRTTA